MYNLDEIHSSLDANFIYERNQGLDYEVQRVLPSGWAVEYMPDGYSFVGPWSDEWESSMWKLVRFLSYKSFLALRKTGQADSMVYEMVSAKDSGVGFRMIFRADKSKKSFC